MACWWCNLKANHRVEQHVIMSLLRSSGFHLLANPISVEIGLERVFTGEKIINTWIESKGHFQYARRACMNGID